ncbi:MAG TPA: hypothetical protein VJZ26_12385 [Blastocatellia bacterium]|nr:hypothetical protein [Blastocatellia bacterium]
MTTRKLEEPLRFKTPTQPSNAGFTSPAYLPPDAFLQQSAATRGMGQSGQKKTIITLAVLVAVLLIALSGLAFFTFFRNTNSGPRAGAPPFPTAPTPEVPQVPRPPQAPSQPGARTATAKELIYPGARVINEITGEENQRVLQLTTTDDFDKVVDWYTERIKAQKPLRVVGITAVLKGDGVTVVVTGADGGANIFITQKADR